jgi:hypothetical protein
MTQEEIAARAARDQALADTDYLMMPDYPLMPAGKMLVSIYRQKLRDWPQEEGFPDLSTMPQPGDWSIYKPVETILDTKML